MSAPISSPDQVKAAGAQLASALALTIRSGHNAVLASDADGTIMPIRANPMDCRVVPSVVDAYQAFGNLPHGSVRIITGGSGERTAHVLAASGLRAPAYANYGGDRVQWDAQGHPKITEHPEASTLADLWTDLRQRLAVALAADLNAPVEHVLSDDIDRAIDSGGYFFENKKIMVSIQPKGHRTDLLAALERSLNVVMPTWLSATDNDRIAANVSWESNNGNWEISAIHLSKFDAIDEIIREHDPKLLIFNVDDVRDIPGIDRVEKAKQHGIHTFVGAVYNAPDAPNQRTGTPVEIIERADIVFESSDALGRFIASVLEHAAHISPA
jgi:hypothetical protein